MASTTTLNETTLTPVTGAEYVRLATTGANWKATVSALQIAGSGGGTTNFLRADGTWASPGGGVTSFNTRTGAVTLVAADMPLFTSVAEGAVAASGGGTTNFLRADGTWAAPAGGSPGGSNTDVQFNNSSAFGGDGGFTYAGSGQATLALGTITANAKALNITATWNNAGVTFDAPLFMNITNTASHAGSLLADLQVGSASAFSISAQAALTLSSPVNATPTQLILTGQAFGGNAGTGAIWLLGENDNGNKQFWFGDVDLVGNGSGWFSRAVTFNNHTYWDSVNGTNTIAGPFYVSDLTLLNWAALTTARTLQVYNTADSSITNYERGVFDWTTTANVLTIGTQAGGTGSARSIQIVVGTAKSVQILTDSAPQLNLQNQTVWMRWGQTNTGRLIFGDTVDTALIKVAAGVIGFGDGSSNTAIGSWMQWAGQTRVTSDVTFTSNTTLGTVTGLSVNVNAGRTYSFEAYLSFTDAAAGGAKAAIAGTATATAIEYDGWMVADNAIKGQAQATALATTVASSVTVGTSGIIQIKGTITVNAAGTLLVQAAQNTSSGTATTIKRGSYFIVHDMP